MIALTRRCFLGLAGSLPLVSALARRAWTQTSARVRLDDGSTLAYDRMVLSPGVEFRWGAIEGYDAAASEVFPHAWQAGPQTIMPAYYKVEGLQRVLEHYRGKPILTAQQVEGVVAYLLTLK